MRRTHVLTPLLALAVLAPGCGGGSGGGSATQDVPAQSVSVAPDAGRSGRVFEADVPFTGPQRGADGLAEVGQSDLTSGQFTVPTNVRCVLLFSHAAVPVGATIDAAVLSLRPSEVTGDPTGSIQHCQIDRVDVGGSLDAADFDGGTLAAAFANVYAVGEPVTVGVPKLVDVTAQVQADRAVGRKISAFRFFFPNATTSGPVRRIRYDAADPTALTLTVTFR